MAEEEVVEKVTTVESAPEQVVKTTTTVVPPPVKTEHPQKVFNKKKAIFRSYQVIWYILAVVEILLAFRVALKAIGANPNSMFVMIVYALSNPLALPFSGVLGISYSAGSVFEWSSIIAGFVYLIAAYGIMELMQFVKPVSKEEVEDTVDNA